MSKQTPINVALQMGAGSQIEAITGTLGNLLDRKSGESEKGPWSFQRTKISDGTGEIKVVFKNCPPVADGYANADVIIHCGKNPNNGAATGIKIVEDEYNGVVTKELVITGSAKVQRVENAGGDGSSGSDPDWPEAPPESVSSNDAPAPAKKAQSPPVGGDMKDAKSEIMRIANLHLLVSKAVASYEAPAFKAATGMEMGEGQRQAATASIFIESCRTGLVRKMPTAPIKL